MSELPERPSPFQPGTRSSFWQPAEAFERFAPGAFDRTIGQVIPLKYEGRVIGHQRVIAAEVADDGSGVMFTVEVVDRETAP